MAKRYTLARFEHRTMLPFLLILLGIFLLYLGGELLVRSVLKLAAAFGTAAAVATPRQPKRFAHAPPESRLSARSLTGRSFSSS